MLEILKRLSIIQVCGASFSFIASATILFVSRKSFCFFTDGKPSTNAASRQRANNRKGNHHKVCTPYRRIIIGLSFSDLLQSVALLFGPLVPPKGTPQSPFAIGNTASCDVFGSFFYAGSLAVPLYNLALSFYFLCKIKYKMSNECFRKKMEKKLHGFILLFVGSLTLTIALLKGINAMPSGSACHVASIPVGCRDNPNMECVRGLKHVEIFANIYLFTSMVCFVAVTIIMAMISWHILRQQSITANTPCNICILSRIFKHGRREDESDHMYLSRLYLSQMLKQATLYTFVFFITFLFTWISTIFNLIGKPNPMWVLYLMFWFYPFGGALNIFILTRPKILALRMRHPELKWFQAFLLVLKAGVDIPDEVKISQVKSPTPDTPSPTPDTPSPSPSNNDDPTYLFCCWGLCYTYIIDDEPLVHSELQGDRISNDLSNQESNDNESGLSYSSRRGTSLRKPQQHDDSVLMSIEEEGREVEEMANRILKWIDGEDDESLDNFLDENT
ncbi:hypothetical protein CTEN210_08896 [Chaetoceros tenuissimus]|uniref:Uncharacterized protein n=1 Tax=Chaetoceros tenuissimus TaxID=426638 RepID=A0AAD3CWT7_9STRA|nr:hypothetical protein CTEN210_08896 [Chaetoceros tenuissimus]